MMRGKKRDQNEAPICDPVIRIGDSRESDPSDLPFLSAGPVNPFEPAF